MSRKDKNWSAGTLKSRGWTEELISSLLPPAQRHYYNGRRVRTWRAEDVKCAEQTDGTACKALCRGQRPGEGQLDDEIAAAAHGGLGTGEFGVDRVFAALHKVARHHGDNARV